MKTEDVRHDLAALFSQHPIPLPFFERIFPNRKDYLFFLRVIIVQLFSHRLALSDKMQIIAETDDDQDQLSKRQALEDDIRLLLHQNKISITETHEKMLRVLRGRE